jgi:arginine utilization protein RocB
MDTSSESRGAADAWYDEVRRYTLELVGIQSVSPDRQGEDAVAAKVRDLLAEGGPAAVYDALAFAPLKDPDDPYGRRNVYALLRGASPRTVVLLGHIDTVGLGDYGEALRALALRPEDDAGQDSLSAHLDELRQVVPASDRALLDDDLTLRDEQGRLDWMFGRGAMDMKSGLAVNIAVMRALARQKQAGVLPLSVVLLATPDEENDSAGVLAAVKLLLDLKDAHGLDYLGSINTDCTTALYPGDPHRYAYTGSVGKLLPNFLVLGVPAHVGDPFLGMDANLIAAELISRLSMNADLCDPAADDATAPRQVTPPPVTLHAQDLKDTYNVQLPFAAHFYLNVLTYRLTPRELLERLRIIAGEALDDVLERVDRAERRWLEQMHDPAWQAHLRTRRGAGRVLTYADLWQAAVERYGKTLGERAEQALREAFAAEWAAVWRRGAAAEPRWDARRRSLELVRWLWGQSGLSAPAVVIYYTPPYYPHANPQGGALVEALRVVAPRHAVKVDDYFPFLSDMSYLRLDVPETDLEALSANMPLWQRDAEQPRPGGYQLPLTNIRRLGLPCIDIGPHGRNAHKADERVLKSYSFGELPQIVWEIIEALG